MELRDCNMLMFMALMGSVLIISNTHVMLIGADPTDGFTNVRLTKHNFLHQKPYDTPIKQRYSFKNGIRRFWVYADDKPFSLGSNTQPRTEVLIKPDYTSGVWQFEGHAFVPNGTSGATIVQIHGAAHGNTTCLLRIYDGSMRFYSGALVDSTNLYDKWFRVNIIHDVDGGMVTVFIDGVQKFQTHDQGPGILHFKCGVYGAPTNISYYMESRWRDIKLYKK